MTVHILQFILPWPLSNGPLFYSRKKISIAIFTFCILKYYSSVSDKKLTLIFAEAKVRLIQANTQSVPAAGQENPCIHRLREPGTILSVKEVKTGGYYIFKEKFGMVAVVKVVQNTSTEDWAGFRLKIKRILYSPWNVPVGTVFEQGYSPETSTLPTSWHFEPCMSLVKSVL